MAGYKHQLRVPLTGSRGAASAAPASSRHPVVALVCCHFTNKWTPLPSLPRGTRWDGRRSRCCQWQAAVRNPPTRGTCPPPPPLDSSSVWALDRTHCKINVVFRARPDSLHMALSPCSQLVKLQFLSFRASPPSRSSFLLCFGQTEANSPWDIRTWNILFTPPLAAAAAAAAVTVAAVVRRAAATAAGVVVVIERSAGARYACA